MRIHDHYDHEDEMNNVIDTDMLLAKRANQVAHLSDELRNAKALADKLQTLLDSKTHQADALHKELDNAIAANELIADSAKRWQARCEEADSTIDAMLKILRPHAAPVFDEAGTPLDVARYVARRITTDPEPDMDTVPLADLLEAVGTFLEEGQGVRISRLHHGATDMRVYALGLEFVVDSHEASETLTHAHELAQHLLEDEA